jgi:hypothetical protein
MPHTHNKDLETHLNSTLDAKMEDMKQDMKKDIPYMQHVMKKDIIDHIENQLDSFATHIMEKLNILGRLTSFKQPFNPKCVASSNSQTFHSNPLHRDLHLLRVESNKFDGSEPTGWVTQMEHYLSLHGITDDLEKLH